VVTFAAKRRLTELCLTKQALPDANLGKQWTIDRLGWFDLGHHIANGAKSGTNA
jgi:hypothetical protein